MMHRRSYIPRGATRALLIACLTASCLPLSRAIAAGPAGAADFSSRCGGCHSSQANGIGPALGGVYGRPSGTASGYNYSRALENAKIVWNDQTLNKFLQNPSSMLPGTKMFVSVPDAATRQQIIAYLKDQKQASSK